MKNKPGQRVTIYRVAWNDDDQRKGKPKLLTRWNKGDGNFFTPCGRGGAVLVEIFEGNTVTRGLSVCSMSDTFSRKEGVKIARQRAQSNNNVNEFLLSHYSALVPDFLSLQGG